MSPAIARVRHAHPIASVEPQDPGLQLPISALSAGITAAIEVAAEDEMRELSAGKAVDLRALELDEEELGAGMRARLGARSGRTSVPSIWIGGECIGGLNDGMPGLVPLDEERVGADGEESELDRRLRAVGAVC